MKIEIGFENTDRVKEDLVNVVKFFADYWKDRKDVCSVIVTEGTEKHSVEELMKVMEEVFKGRPYYTEIFNIKEYIQEGENVIEIENIDYIGGIGPINVYGIIKLESGDLIQIKTDKTWLGSNTNKNDWNNVKSFGKPPKATGGLNYPDFENNIPSKADDTMPFLNTLISKISKKYFWLVKLIVKLFNRYDILE